MRSVFTLSLCLAFLPISQSTGLLRLENYFSSDPTLVANVQDGSKLYLASSDKAVKLKNITLTTNGNSITMDQLLLQSDDNGFRKGWPVNKDLTISTTNSVDVTHDLEGVFFISNPEMAKDPNFLVYVVNGDNVTIDRSTNTETTLLLLNLRVNKTASDPVYKSFYNTRVENFWQPNTTKLYFYRETPGDGYTNSTYKETLQKMIFTNPVSLYPTGHPDADTYFFDNIEPVQYSLMTWHIRAIGGIKFDVNRNWVDPSTYSTTKETTTGYTMSQLFTYNTTVNFKNTPNNNGIMGLLITTELFSKVDIAMTNDIVFTVLNLNKDKELAADYNQWNFNATKLYVEPSAPDSGVYYVQYCRIEGNVLPSLTNSTSTTPLSVTGTTLLSVTGTTPLPVETTTKSASTSLTIVCLMIQFLLFLRV